MATAEFRAALAELLAEASRRPTTVMCAEAVPWRCHRQLLADAAAAAGWQVAHVLDERTLRPHTMSADLRRREDGTLVYPAAGQLGLPGLGAPR
jgi:uncharacterized protein (DUF488 family)